MEQKAAKELYHNSGILIFLDVPEGTEFGIDMKSWNTGEKFRGVKMIPPGLHYIFYSSVNSTGDVAPRSGFFHNFKKSELVVKKWDKDTDDISKGEVSEEDISNLRNNIKFLDGFLGPYPHDVYEKWKLLSSNLNDNLVQKLIPVAGIVRSALELESCTDADRPRGQIREEPTCTSSKIVKKCRLSDEFGDDNLLPNLKAKAGTDLRVTEFPEKHYPLGSSASNITHHSLDSTYVFDCMISKYDKPTDLIGELEFSYICFLVGHSLEAFEHWKKLVSLFCSCELAIKKYRRLYDMLINILEIQVAEIPEEFLADIVTNNNFIYIKLRNLFRSVQSSDIDGQLKNKVDRFRRLLTENYSWDFQHLDSEDEEDAPVVVKIEV